MSDEDKSRIKEYYDLLSDSYDELYGKEQAKKHDRILGFLDKQRFDLLIEVGCGTGVMLEQAAPSCSWVVGTDISPNMLRKARLRANREIMDFLVSDGSALPFKDQVSDLVISISVLKSDSKHQFLELSRIAKHNGTILVTLFPSAGTSDTEWNMALHSSRKVLLTERETLHVFRVSHPKERTPGKGERGFSFL